MAADRHNCPDCGASHRKNAPKTNTRTSTAHTTELDIKRCPKCRASTLAGRVQGLDLHLDPQSLNEIGAQAFRATKRLIVIRRGWRGRFHDGWKQWPPDDDTAWHVIHDCDRPVPRELAQGGPPPSRKTTTTDPLPDTPPY
ncbi:hypothetical protein [Gordonia alkaliphila]|uniref:Uncharacterized protein n=1 Tax=Gordonia alkaliphila TaxID=1053547 RepID=A0ABP8ZHS6_9ACTN